MGLDQTINNPSQIINLLEVVKAMSNRHLNVKVHTKREEPQFIPEEWRKTTPALINQLCNQKFQNVGTYNPTKQLMP